MNKIRPIHLFLFGVVLKVMLFPFFGSTYLRDLFIPFVDYFVQNPTQNPWAHFTPEYFPYGGVLLGLLFIPKFFGYLLFNDLALGSSPLSLALMKLPLFAFDLLLLWVLFQFSKKSLKPLLYLYWLNPILIYINYIHGQLDGVAMCFAILSLYFISQNKINSSAMAMAAAVLCKFHVVAIIPLLLIFIWKSDIASFSFPRIIRWGVVFALLTFAGLLPVLLGGKFLYVTVSSPQASRVFGIQVDFGHGRLLLIGLGIMILTMGRLCLSSSINLRGLVFGSSVLLGMVLMVTAPMPGWYYWVVPFLALFYATYYTNHRAIFFLFALSYLGYFASLDYAIIENVQFLALLFTLTQVSLLASLLEIWILVINKEMPIGNTFKPMMLGIGGDSASGKNTFCNLLSDVLGDENSLILEGDDYHRWDRQGALTTPYTHLHPKANFLHELASHASELSHGRFVFQPQYDHQTGQFSLPRAIRPRRAILIQGLHALYLKGLREKYDLTIFLAPDPMVQLAWKLKRDTKERGHSASKIIEDMQKREADSLSHIQPQKEKADWIIEYFPVEKITKEDVVKGKDIELAVRHTLWNDDPVEVLFDELRKKARCQINVDMAVTDIDRIIATIHGNPTSEEMKAVAESVFPDFRQITRNRKRPVWRDGLRGVSQLIALALIKKR